MRHKTNDTKKASKAKKRRKKLSLKYQIFLYMALLCAIMISFLFVFQVFMLDDFYFHVTLSSLKDAASTYKGVTEGELEDHNNATSSECGAFIVVCSQKGAILARSGEYPSSLIAHVGADTLENFYKKTVSGGGEHYEIIDLSEIAVNRPEKPLQNEDAQIPDDITLPSDEDFSPPAPDTENENDNPNPFVSSKRLVYSSIQYSESGAEQLVIFDCALTPLDTVSKTIHIQLCILSILCILLCAAIALLFSLRVSRPISKINESANRLARGDYSVLFEGGGCREIDELCETLQYSSEELSKLEVMQNELISNISHDLRTPLTMIGGYAEVMRDIPGENTPENVQVIIDETNRLSSLVNNLLEISKIRQNSNTLELSVFCLSDVLDACVKRFSKLNESQGYTITVDAKEKAFVCADKEKITQVIYNLIGNAINYTGEDKCVFITQTCSEDTVRIDIYDTGDGIEPEKLPHIWQRYYRADSYHKRSELGMGLGLSIVKDILDAHNAAFGVSSKLGRGSDFWFKLHTVKKTDIMK